MHLGLLQPMVPSYVRIFESTYYLFTLLILCAVVINVAISWSSADDDGAVFGAASSFISRANATGYFHSVEFPFIYQNYAALEQPMFEGYGQKNLAKLRAVSEKYDPFGVWQILSSLLWYILRIRAHTNRMIQQRSSPSSPNYLLNSFSGVTMANTLLGIVSKERGVFYIFTSLEVRILSRLLGRPPMRPMSCK
jgi:hypothetical protein